MFTHQNWYSLKICMTCWISMLIKCKQLRFERLELNVTKTERSSSNRPAIATLKIDSRFISNFKIKINYLSKQICIDNFWSLIEPPIKTWINGTEDWFNWTYPKCKPNDDACTGNSYSHTKEFQKFFSFKIRLWSQLFCCLLRAWHSWFPTWLTILHHSR